MYTSQLSANSSSSGGTTAPVEWGPLGGGEITKGGSSSTWWSGY